MCERTMFVVKDTAGVTRIINLGQVEWISSGSDGRVDLHFPSKTVLSLNMSMSELRAWIPGLVR